ncbi:MAG: sulfotransferase [Deltaproteobacteria bacterium]|nr:sulfotransferase [Deltaproteobacteria bacterium]MBW2342557.1 sulfotransferase [Deltaproteobacteria bacterium]
MSCAKKTLTTSTKEIVKRVVGDRIWNELKVRFEMRVRKNALHRGAWDDFCRVCLKHYKPITAPMILVSQIQRSGGTLLSQLLDGHSELHAHPYELKIGHPSKYIWPDIRLDSDPETWFEILFEDVVIKLFRDGYQKGRKDDESFPFIFLPYIQRRIFLDYLRRFRSVSLRDVFDGYMTSFFNAWIDNHNNVGHKKYVSAFTAGLATNKQSVDRFFEVYPDGYMISIIRDPKNWYPSALRHRPDEYSDVDKGLDFWNRNAKAILRNKEEYSDRVCIIKFEDLVGRTEDIMRFLCSYVGIGFEDIAVVPTFNKWPIRANTSFDTKEHGVVGDTLQRYTTLGKEILDRIESLTNETYGRLLEKADVL